MKLNIAVLFGGESVEHEVSIISAHQAMAALDREKYNVIPVYISKDRKLFSSDQLFDMSIYKNLNELKTRVPQVYFISIDNKVLLRPVKTGLFGPKDIAVIDVAVPIMHGTNGEDGTIQGFLEMYKLPYTGCDLIAAAIGQDKVLQKHTLENSGLPITDWFWVYGRELDTKKDEILNQAQRIGYPLILKPACTGSSVGINIAHNEEEYLWAFEEAARYDNKVITEKVVRPMREINCSVLGDPTDAIPSVLEEVFHSDASEILDFHDKYEQGKAKGAKAESGAVKSSAGMAGTSRRVNPDLPEGISDEIKRLALETFRVLGSSGVCRIDFLMDAESNQVFVNEINTIPGSLAYYLWSDAGVPFPKLMDRLVDLALERERRRASMIFSYDTDLLKNYSEPSGAKGAKR